MQGYNRLFGCFSAAGVAAAVFAVSASAATFFTNDAAFQVAAGGGLNFESFEQLTATNVRSDRNSVVTSGFTLSTPAGNELSIFNVDDGGSHAIQGSNYVLWGDFASGSFPTPNDELLFMTFAQPIDAFSLYLTDALDLSGTGASISFSNNLGDTATIATAPLANGAEVFFGVISPGMTSISIATSAGYFAGDRLGIDSVSYRLIPEPSTAVLAFLGLCGTGWCIASRRQ